MTPPSHHRQCTNPNMDPPRCVRCALPWPCPTYLLRTVELVAGLRTERDEAVALIRTIACCDIPSHDITNAARAFLGDR